jgi:hypothetical protein
MTMNTYALEIATFRAEPTPEFLAARATAMDTIARVCEGFVSSRLLSRDDGALVDEVVWATREAAEAGAEQVQTIPEAGAYFGHITEVVSMEHATILVP